MVILLALQFSLGILLVYAISSRPTPLRFRMRVLNFVCAIPGSIAATGAVVYQHHLDVFSSSLISGLLFCLLLTFTLRGRSSENAQKLFHSYPPE